MIPTDLVIRLRDLRGEHETREWSVPWGARYPSYQFTYTAALLEAAATVMAWRCDPDDQLAEPDHGAELSDAVTFTQQIAGVMVNNTGLPSLCGADCTLVAVREPHDPDRTS